MNTLSPVCPSPASAGSSPMAASLGSVTTPRIARSTDVPSANRGARGIRSVRVVLEARKALGLVLLRERVDHVVDVAVHTPLEVREVVAEALVGEAILREVVRAHLLGALPM